MGNLYDYRIRFLDAKGALLEDISLSAESLAVAIDCAEKIGMEMQAAGFYVTSRPEIDEGHNQVAFEDASASRGRILAAHRMATRAFKTLLQYPACVANISFKEKIASVTRQRADLT